MLEETMELSNGGDKAVPVFNTTVVKRDGTKVPYDNELVRLTLMDACKGYEQDVSIELLINEVNRTIFDGIPTSELEKALIMAATVFIEYDPAYGKVAARLVRMKLMGEIAQFHYDQQQYRFLYKDLFVKNIQCGVSLNLLDKRLVEYDLEKLSGKLVIDRDELIDYMGMQTLYERYLLRFENRRLELVQAFWMRIAMGLALNEKNKHERALEFYELMSTLKYVPSTPTLFHSGFPVAQLSSCYLNVVYDDLGHIFKCLGDNAQLSKWAGGIGTSWTNIRATGSFIKSIKATSQGVIPYIKIANDVVVAITRSGIRRGGCCVYLEPWHLDTEDYLDLRRNTGDERRRAHDINTALWIPDLFMKRVLLDGVWTLFSPNEVPDLPDLYGKAFDERYAFYEKQAVDGTITHYKQISAKQLWRKILTRLFETGHPWITFKDPSNIRSPQDHVGVIHNSNLCTEITLNTSAEETAVCNLGSINLERHIKEGKLDKNELEKSITIAVRMLDNVIDLSFYPTTEARNANMRHRPVGLGLMGFQDALFLLDIPFSSQEARTFADASMELISYYAIKASCLLAQERGAYLSYPGSKWSRGIFPVDTLGLLEQERGMKLKLENRTGNLNWEPLRALVASYGMRNSNVMAIAPTATIATIAGCYPCIEPPYKNIYVKSNVSGEFTVVNKYLIEDLKKLGMWNTQVLNQLKYYDGDISRISSLSAHLREKYKTAFELDPRWLVAITGERGKWIDQSQSHNVFHQQAASAKAVSGQELDSIYMSAWLAGLKTTYYYRSMGATQIEKSTLDAKEFGYTQKRYYEPASSQACSLENLEECESCQ
jgi:ribonucleoside-diphosphate reductase alpha chain